MNIKPRFGQSREALDLRRRSLAALGDFAKSVRILLVSSAYGDPVLDRRLLDEHAHKIAPARRVGIVVSLIVWVAFSIRDFSSVSGSLQLTAINFYSINWYLFSLRFIGISAILAAMNLSLRSNFRQHSYSELLLSISILMIYCLILGFISEMDLPFDYIRDLPALIVFFFTVISLFRLRMRTVLSVAILCFPASMIAFYRDALTSLAMAHTAVGQISSAVVLRSDYFIGPSMYLAAAMLIGVAVAGLLERDALQALLREQKLAKANSDLISARRDAEAKTLALVAAKDQLRLLAERESQQKSMFLADAAHDLSQPMHAISLLIEPARQAVHREDLVRAKSLIDEVTRAVHVARSSFVAVLEASQLQSGLVKAKLGGCDIERLVAEILTPLEIVAKSKGVRLKLRRPKSGPIAVHTDPALFAHLVGNLASNAIKYSDPVKGASRTVVVGIIPFANRVRVDVLDNGIGIPEQNWKKIFQPFVQLSNPERNRDMGLGLGLSIVSAIVQILPEHRLDMRSIEGRWTRFSLEVPRYRDALESPNIEWSTAAGVMKLEELYVFYVEDDETLRMATTVLLSDVGILVEVAASVAQVEAALPDCERRPDLVISDFRLPHGKTAVNVAQLFRARWDEEVPILVLTGDTTPPSPDLIGGAAIVLRKPTAPQDLLNAIQNLCSRALSDSKNEEAEIEGAFD